MSEHKELVERLRGFIVRDDSGLGPRIGLKGINVSDIEDAIRDLEAQAAEIERLRADRAVIRGLAALETSNLMLAKLVENLPDGEDVETDLNGHRLVYTKRGNFVGPVALYGKKP